jgi:hypothetical protein
MPQFHNKTLTEAIHKRDGWALAGGVALGLTNHCNGAGELVNHFLDYAQIASNCSLNFFSFLQLPQLDFSWLNGSNFSRRSFVHSLAFYHVTKAPCRWDFQP